MHTLRLFSACVLNASWEDERSTPGSPRRVMLDIDGMSDFIDRHFTGLNLVAEWVDLPEEEVKRISFAAMEPLGFDKKDAADSLP